MNIPRLCEFRVVPVSTPPNTSRLIFSLQISNGDDKILGNRLHR
jgi:hypothetical protein